MAVRELAPRLSDAASLPAEPASHTPRWLAAGTQVLLAALCWLALAAVVYATDPDNAVFRTAFFLLLFGAIAFTLTPILHALMLRLSHSRIFQQQSGTIAARQSVMLAAFVVLNALLQMLRVWTGLTALLLFGMFAVIEIVALARR